MSSDPKSIYRTRQIDDFPAELEIAFGPPEARQVLVFRKTEWELEEGKAGLRYGENPDQPAALYHLVHGKVRFGDRVLEVRPRPSSSRPRLLQSGKHPSKTNITDVDAALGILRWFDRPTCVVIKHNNPCGAAVGATPEDAFLRAWEADPIAAFGGVVGINRPVGQVLAEELTKRYVEVVVAPDYEEGVLDTLRRKPALRVLQIEGWPRREEAGLSSVLEWRGLVDGGLVLQWSQRLQDIGPENYLPARTEHEGRVYEVSRLPQPEQWSDLDFAWKIAASCVSNAVVLAKGGMTLGIACGLQDRLGAAWLAVKKAYRNHAERLALRRFGQALDRLDGPSAQAILEEVRQQRAELPGAVMASDGFFPFPDALVQGLEHGVSAVVQPGGSIRDHEVIEACNRYGAAMIFTGQRCFRH